MRLLNTETLELAEFFDSKVPKYAILSHRWGEREIAFKEILKRTAPAGPALRKIERCCRLAASNGLQWVWIDTCCIDKRSSAELSEAINSMYKWYQRSDICYVYLNDFHSTPNSSWDKPLAFSWNKDFSQKFCASLWFTRGWTLQELLAPEALVFFDANWQEIGTRQDLCKYVSAATRIPRRFLAGRSIPDEVRISTTMSFAAHRTTSREEDIAYCLLGLFGVNMPLLYGEGAFNAFQRLQIEIIRKSSDESIFAWTSNEPASGMLAPNPSCFAGSGGMATNILGLRASFTRRFAMSNIGLEFPIPDHLSNNGIIAVYLNCSRSRNIEIDFRRAIPETKALCIQLRVQQGVAFRVRCDTIDSEEYPQDYQPHTVLDLKTDLKKTRAIYIKQPDEVEVEYSRILQEIEEGDLQFAKLPSVTTATQGVTFLNPVAVPLAADSGRRFINPGDGSPEEEANARWHTFNALMITAGDVLYSGASRDSVLSQDVELMHSSIPMVNVVTDSGSDADTRLVTAAPTGYAAIT
ncbi:MAG: hypothetical protein Q9168_005214 [Polycauliona sp. 1 TL-2023]